jgi:hypothetical protein
METDLESAAGYRPSPMRALALIPAVALSTLIATNVLRRLSLT